MIGSEQRSTETFINRKNLRNYYEFFFTNQESMESRKCPFITWTLFKELIALLIAFIYSEKLKFIPLMWLSQWTSIVARRQPDSLKTIKKQLLSYMTDKSFWLKHSSFIFKSFSAFRFRFCHFSSSYFQTFNSSLRLYVGPIYIFNRQHYRFWFFRCQGQVLVSQQDIGCHDWCETVLRF